MLHSIWNTLPDAYRFVEVFMKHIFLYDKQYGFLCATNSVSCFEIVDYRLHENCVTFTICIFKPPFAMEFSLICGNLIVYNLFIANLL